MSRPENWRGSVHWPRVPQLVQAMSTSLTSSGSAMPFFSATASCRWSARNRLWHDRHSTSGSENVATWPEAYPWIVQEGLQYFRSRIPLAGRDVEHGLAVTLDYFRTPAAQRRAIEILQFKLDILWSMLDAIERGYAR